MRGWMFWRGGWSGGKGSHQGGDMGQRGVPYNSWWLCLRLRPCPSSLSVASSSGCPQSLAQWKLHPMGG